jgi:hypothetical protein
MSFYGSENWTLREVTENPGKFWNVVLKKDGEEQLDPLCEK